MKVDFIQSMRLRFWLALGLIAILATITFGILREETRAKQSHAALINVSGRQRMLSQRLALFSLQLIDSHTPPQREQIRRELQDAAALMDTYTNGLIRGDTLANLPGNPSAQLRAIYFSPPVSLEKRVRHYIAEVEALLRAPEADLTPENSNLKNILAMAESEMPEALDIAVKQYQRESEAGIAQLQHLEMFVLSANLLLLLIIGHFVFRPMIHRLQNHIAEREKLIAELQIALANVKTLRGLVPICASCKKIRDDSGYWNILEDYIVQHSEADFTHSFCPDCKQKFDEE
ncbi:MAG: hypothetical protein ALAOOOJD_04353 [bacterium]|nr:hypothetical protein [bacterium]